jgi:DNA-binding transcriptional LysR family regulator
MDIRDKDLNLLVILKTLLEELNLSKAGKRLGLSQPAVSHALSRLRDQFDDPLLVRTSHGMRPTPRAQEMSERIRHLINEAEQIFQKQESFDPSTAKGRVVIATTDYFDQLVMPRLVPILMREAPDVQIVTKISSAKSPREELERGESDLAIAGFFSKLGDGLYQQKLFDENFVAIVRKNHPIVKSKLSLKQFIALDHLLVSPHGDMDGVVDVALRNIGESRRIVAGVASFASPGMVLAESDAVLTIPERVADIYLKYLPLKSFPVPLKIPGFAVLQVWHQRLSQDPLHGWVRKLIYDLVNDPLR